MKVKRFFAPDMRQAIRLVREEQGPDAVILSNRQVDGGIEIIASVDYDEAWLERETTGSTQPEESSAQDNVAEPAEVHRATETYTRNAQPEAQETALPSPSVDWSQDPSIVAMRDEIRQLRGLLEDQLAHLAWGDMKRREPLHADVIRRLSSMEINSRLVERISAPAVHARDEAHAWKLAMAELAANVPVAGEDFLDQGGIVALVGSTGVGKTTSIAKLAARYVLRHGQRHVALVTTDSYRIGAHEQLMTYGRLLGIPVQVASDHNELRSTLNSLSDKRLVLIDTAGMSQRDVRLTEQFATLADTGLPIRTLLVLSATVHPSVMEETIRAFSGVPLDGAILTKLDEAASLGGVLSAVIEQQIPLRFVANGQRVPEDIQVARVSELIQQATDLASERGLPAESMMAETFGGCRANVHV
ncbi:flagellar biosynthesis protein FlhF [Thiogranum longum]|uniref:Flagellar biosynthesis protein FlhF n=1 Tax=Thiogranum longum TaxID=1537524 RepID=A0A4R1HHF6_9GAMM|nr:flagellar biosynthesis protein FlhF [Thiogranum longum]TCK18829.1 flagellar biosynthesis protein FlhF [Thiogranum longum]